MLRTYLECVPVLEYLNEGAEYGLDDFGEGAAFIRNSFEFEPSDQNAYDFERHLHWQRIGLYALARPVESWACSEIFVASRHVLTSHWWVSSANILRSLLDLIQRSSWGVEIWQQRDGEGFSLMHALALACSALEFSFNAPIASQWGDVLADFLKQAIRAGADLHPVPVDDVELTPFAFALAILGGGPHTPWIAWNDQSLQHWVGTLLAEGIDIEKYGRVESEAWLRNKHTYNMSGPRVYGFTCGRQPQHWKVSLEHPGDHYAGLFWDSVEHPERQVPGAWQDDDVSLWEDKYFRNMAHWKSLKKKRAWREYRQKQQMRFEQV